MSEFFLVRDDGFHADDGAAPVVLAPDTDPASLGEHRCPVGQILR